MCVRLNAITTERIPLRIQQLFYTKCITAFFIFFCTKPGGVILTLAGTQNTVNVSSGLNLVAGTLNDGGKILNVSGNIFNSGLATGTGRIVLNGTTAQTINGGGTFGNLELANTSATPVSCLTNDVKRDLNFRC